MSQDFDKLEGEQKKLEDLAALQSYSGKDEIITSEQAWKNLEEERKKPTPKFFSKLPGLDKMLDGFREGDLVVISAPTKMGKTTLAQTFTHNLAEAEIPSLWFSYELTQKEFLEKFGEPMPFFTLPKHLEGNSLDWLEQKIMEAIAKYGIKVCFIDHLHFLLDMSFISNRGNVSLLIGSIMRRLKQIALKWNICIVLIAHTTKISFEKQPDLADIRDSSFISQEADSVMMIWRMIEKETKTYGNKATLALLANRRNGQVGKLKLELKNNRFYELTENYNYAEDNMQ